MITATCKHAGCAGKFLLDSQGQPPTSLAPQLYSEQGDFLSQFVTPIHSRDLAVDSARDRIYLLPGGNLSAYAYLAPHQLVNSWPAPTTWTLDVAADGSLWTGNIEPFSGAYTVARLNATTGSVLQQFSVEHPPMVRASKATWAGPAMISHNSGGPPR